MKTHFGTVFFLCTMFFFVFVVLGNSPLQRIDRACLPVDWLGRAITSIASLAGNAAESRTSIASAELVLSCQYLVFRQFFRDDLEEQRAAAAAADSSQDGQQKKVDQ